MRIENFAYERGEKIVVLNKNEIQENTLNFSYNKEIPTNLFVTGKQVKSSSSVYTCSCYIIWTLAVAQKAHYRI